MPPQSIEQATQRITIKPYAPVHWIALWRLRFAQLAEQGIYVMEETIPPVPCLPEHDTYEWDLNHVNEVYCSGGGGFWMAWLGDEPVGSVGAQDLGSVIELRRMYVKASYRRRGIGMRLVQALIDHCRLHGISAVELWTETGGKGQSLYARFGFQQVENPGLGFDAVAQATHRSHNPEEIRMRLAL